MDIKDLSEYLVAGKQALDIFKGLRSELPKGDKRTEQLQAQIERAEAALRTSEAAAAKALGFHLCQCTFPPQIMLWSEPDYGHKCPRPECGHFEKHVRSQPGGFTQRGLTRT